MYINVKIDTEFHKKIRVFVIFDDFCLIGKLKNVIKVFTIFQQNQGCHKNLGNFGEVPKTLNLINLDMIINHKIILYVDV